MKTILLITAFTASTFAMAAAPKQVYKCNDGGTLELQQSKSNPLSYFASLEYANGSASTLAGINLHQENALKGDMLRDDEEAEMGTAYVVDSGKLMLLSFDSGDKVICELSKGAQQGQPAQSAILSQCTTHTGGKLTITPKEATLVSLNGQSNTFAIVNTQVRVIETYPSILQSKYKLEDGRTIVTEYRGESKTGSGQYIRVGGESSPEFECKM